MKSSKKGAGYTAGRDSGTSCFWLAGKLGTEDRAESPCHDTGLKAWAKKTGLGGGPVWGLARDEGDNVDEVVCILECVAGKSII